MMTFASRLPGAAQPAVGMDAQNCLCWSDLPWRPSAAMAAARTLDALHADFFLLQMKIW